MPLSGGTSGAHDDSMHQGSAKRDVVDGLAGLDGVGSLLVPGSSIYMIRDVGDKIIFRERTSDEVAFYSIRYSANSYALKVRNGAGWGVCLLDLDKDVVDGIAALDAAGALLVPGSKIYYTRDGSDDVHIYERTSNEEAYAFHRVGADDYTFHVKESNVWKRMQTESMKDAANGIAGLDASGEVLNSVLPGLEKEYVISDNLVHSHDTLAINTQVAYTKMKTITINTLYPTPSTLRIKFDLMLTGGDIVYGKLYKNGGAVGTERSENAGVWTTFSEDLSFANGDTLELWGHMVTGLDEVAVKNFRVYGDESDVVLGVAIVAGDVGVADPFVATNSTP